MTEISDYLVPVVVEQTSRGERSFDIDPRLLKDGIGRCTIPECAGALLAYRADGALD